MTRVFVALGGNIEPESRLALAARELRGRFPDVRFSGVYRNPPFGFEGADFYNAAAGFSTALSVEMLLLSLHAIETLCGRHRDDPKWAPRAMDIDLLMYGGTVAKSPINERPAYEIPRPDLLRRCYMLAPLAQIAPALPHPVTHRTIADHWCDLAREPHSLERVALDLNMPL